MEDLIFSPLINGGENQVEKGEGWGKESKAKGKSKRELRLGTERSKN